jgi:hypothetical protein
MSALRQLTSSAEIAANDNLEAHCGPWIIVQHVPHSASAAVWSAL